jgi:hypothetical protein
VSWAWLGPRVVAKTARVKKLARILKRLSGAFRMQFLNEPANLTA